MNNDNKRLILVSGLCIIFYLLYMNYLREKYPNMNKAVEQETVASEQGKKVGNTTNPSLKAAQGEQIVSNQEETSSEETVPKLTNAELTIENADVIYRFNQGNSSVRSIELKKYSAEAGKKDKKQAG